MPTAFNRSAQGWRDAVAPTLGLLEATITNSSGVESIDVKTRIQPRWGWVHCTFFPRVGAPASRQPWAVCWNAVGVLSARCPTHLVRSRDGVPREGRPQRNRCALIKKNLHTGITAHTTARLRSVN